MRRATLIKKLNKASDNPRFRARPYEEIDGSKEGAIFVSCEDCWKDGVPVAMYYENYVNPDFQKLIPEDWHWEWTNPGCLGIYKDH